MAAGTGGSPSVTRLSFGVTTSDWANAGLGRKRAAVRRTHDSLDMCAPTGDVGGQSYGALSTVARCRGAAFTHGPVEELARELAATLPGELDKLYFLSSGSEAIEAALKLARQYWIEAGKPGKHRIIALNPSYHGNTLLALSASAREQYKLPFREWLVDVERIPAPYP